MGLRERLQNIRYLAGRGHWNGVRKFTAITLWGLTHTRCRRCGGYKGISESTRCRRCQISNICRELENPS